MRIPHRTCRPNEPIAGTIASDDDGHRPPGTVFGVLPGTHSSKSSTAELSEFPADYPLLVEVRVDGMIERIHEFPPDFRGQSRGKIGAGGVFSGWDGTCVANVTVSFSAGGGVKFCRGRFAEDSATWRRRAVVLGGTVTATRAGGPTKYWLRCDGLYGIPCYLHEGSQTVSVTIIADELNVAADTNHVAAGTPIRFTAHTKNGAPFSVLEWM